MPTLPGLAGVKIPGGVQGADYSKFLAGGRPPKYSDTVLQFPAACGELWAQGFPEYRGLRAGQYTYVRSINGPWLLYDNDADPYQMRNLADSREHRNLQSRPNRTLDARPKALEDDFLPGQEHIRRFGYVHNRDRTSDRALMAFIVDAAQNWFFGARGRKIAVVCRGLGLQ